MTATDGDAFEALQRFADVWHDKYAQHHGPCGENRKPPSLTMRANGVAAVLTEPQLGAVVAEYVRMRQEREDPEQGACVCGDPDCMPYWRPVHEQMNAMRVQADRNAADFTKAMLEEICELRAQLDQERAQRKAGQDGDVQAVAPCCGGPHAGWIHAADCGNPAAADVEQRVLLPLLLKDDAMRTAAARLAADSEEADVAAWYTARAAVRQRSTDRIAAMEAREAAAGGVHPNGDPIWEEQ